MDSQAPQALHSSFVPKALIAVGAWLLLAACCAQPVAQEVGLVMTNRHVTGSRPVTLLRSSTGDDNNQPEQIPTKASVEAALGATALGIAAAQAENHHLLPMPWATTGLSLGLLGVLVFLFGEWRRPGPGFALAGPSMPEYGVQDDELDLAEMAAKPLAMSVTAGSGKVAGEILITVEKPLGLTLGEGKNESIVVTFVNPLGNGAKAGIKTGDRIIYHSSFFGEELWPAGGLGFVRTTINATPGAVDFIVMRGAAADQVNVKKLPKRPAPPKIGRKLTAAQRERATHICLDCGWIYALPQRFDDQPKDYRCPQCQATKSRFAEYDIQTGKVIGGNKLPAGILAGVLGGALAVAGLAYVATQL